MKNINWPLVGVCVLYFTAGVIALVNGNWKQGGLSVLYSASSLIMLFM